MFFKEINVNLHLNRMNHINMDKTKELINTIVNAIQEKKGQDISIVDLHQIEGAIARYFVICQGNSPTQVEAIHDSIEEFTLKEHHEKPVKVIGLGLSQWVAMDYVDVIVHIFLPDARTFYDLDGLWGDAEVTDIPNLD